MVTYWLVYLGALVVLLWLRPAGATIFALLAWLIGLVVHGTLVFVAYRLRTGLSWLLTLSLIVYLGALLIPGLASG